MDHDSEKEVFTDFEIEAFKEEIDLTLIRENLKLTAEQRLLKLEELSEFAQELRAAGDRLRQRAAQKKGLGGGGGAGSNSQRAIGS